MICPINFTATPAEIKKHLQARCKLYKNIYYIINHVQFNCNTKEVQSVFIFVRIKCRFCFRHRCLCTINIISTNNMIFIQAALYR